MKRYHDYIISMPEYHESDDLKRVADNCLSLSQRPPKTFHEAVQSLWFLFVILHMESNASSFSPGRMDQYLYPYYEHDLKEGLISKADALEIFKENAFG